MPQDARSPAAAVDCQLHLNRPSARLRSEYKIRKLAEILGANVDQVSSLVKMRPGLLVVPNNDMSYVEQRVSMLALKHGLSQSQVSAMVLQNPQLLFQRA